MVSSATPGHAASAASTNVNHASLQNARKQLERSLPDEVAGELAKQDGGRTPLLMRFQQVREFTAYLCDPLETEDYCIQSMPDASPTKWHLAHTTWFFETFVLAENTSDYVWFEPGYRYLFNSYYNGVGSQFPRAQRDMLSRPSVAEVYRYRHAIDEAMMKMLAECSRDTFDAIAPIVELGLQHEQQHQELMLTDLKHMLSINPLAPVYRKRKLRKDDPAELTRHNWHRVEGGLYDIGHTGEAFSYDNESPAHKHYLQPFEIACTPVTCGQFIRFIEDGGYERPEFWLSEGWSITQAEGRTAPLYWQRRNDDWYAFTLAGAQPLAIDEPVCHISLFEADAFARWAGARLPTEQEWEVASQAALLEGNFADSGRFHPAPLHIDEPHCGNPKAPGAPRQPRRMFGDVWEWTASQYRPYPGYKAPPGALGEYNGKFMSSQFVLRGGSCATPPGHIRRTYRNFFPPDARWQFSGCRLARDAEPGT